MLYQHGHNFMREAMVMRIHDVQGHLHGVKYKSVGESSVQHFQMDVRVLVTSKTDVTDFARLFRRKRRLEGAIRAKDALRVALSNDFVELHQVDGIGL